MIAAVPDPFLRRPRVKGQELWSPRLTTGVTTVPGLGDLLVASCSGDQLRLNGDRISDAVLAQHDTALRTSLDNMLGGGVTDEA